MMTTVPDIEQMSDEIFIKHMCKRHSHEVDPGLKHAHHIMESWVNPYRAYHDKLHELSTPGAYDHEHI